MRQQGQTPEVDISLKTCSSKKATSNKCHASSNRCLTSSNKKVRNNKLMEDRTFIETAVGPDGCRGVERYRLFFFGARHRMCSETILPPT